MLTVSPWRYEDRDQYTRLIKKLGLEANVIVNAGFVDQNKVRFYFCAADLVAQPYLTATQSGVTQMAYSYDLPVVVTKVGGLPEIVDEGQSGFTIEPDNPKELANILEKNLQVGAFLEMPTYIKHFKQKFSWEYFVNGIESVYSKI